MWWQGQSKNLGPLSGSLVKSVWCDMKLGEYVNDVVGCQEEGDFPEPKTGKSESAFDPLVPQLELDGGMNLGSSVRRYFSKISQLF